MERHKPEDVIGGARPSTGREYLESLRDGREVYIYGERVKDVFINIQKGTDAGIVVSGAKVVATTSWGRTPPSRSPTPPGP